jgi:hypothetical protein
MKTKCRSTLTATALAGILLGALMGTTARADAVDPMVSGSADAAVSDVDTPDQTSTTAPDRKAPKQPTPGRFNIDSVSYLWFSGVHGNATLLDNNYGFKASADDLLKHARFGLTHAFDVRYKRILLTDDIMYMALTDTKSVTLRFPNVPTITGQDLLRLVVFTQKVGYRVIDKPKLKADFLTGFRFWHFGNSLTVRPATPQFNIVYKSTNWTDPLVGGRIIMPLSPKMSFTAAGDVGGWGTGSQLEYQIVGGLNYQLKPKWNLTAGYRYLYFDLGQYPVVTKVAMSGPMVAASYTFRRAD